MHNCSASIAPELFLALGNGCMGPSLGLPLYKILFQLLSKLNKLLVIQLSEAGIHSCSVWKRKAEDFLKHNGLLSNCVPGKLGSIQLHCAQDDRAVMFLLADHVAQIADPSWKCVSRYEENTWVGRGSVRRGECSTRSLSSHCNSSAVGWL